MPISAGELRHRVRIEAYRALTDSSGETIQDPVSGEVKYAWELVATVWAKIAPMSAREFIQSQATQSQINARIVIRYRDDLTPDMRLVHAAKNKIYNPKAFLPDLDSGLEYLTIPVTEGTGDGL